MTTPEPQWKSIRIDAHPGGFSVVVGVGVSMQRLAEAPTMALAKVKLREQANRLKAIDAEERGNRWLADANEAAEAGNKAKAERCYEKGQFWLDRFNRLTGRA